MRNTFAAEVTSLATADKRIVVLSGDIGNRLFDKLKAAAPGRFLNCGVAEANMTGVAAGMALCGLRPVTYTITPFVTTRCLEQIRVDICYQNLPVIIVGTGSGLSYASLGTTHHSCEDIAFLRAIPNMTVICPADPMEARLALRAALRHPGPVYIRLGKKGEPPVHPNLTSFEIGKGIVVKPGHDVCLLSTGTILPVVMEAAELFAEKGLSAEVVSLHTVKPVDSELLARAFSSFKLVVTVEEHSRLGGLGGSVAEWHADHPATGGQVCRIGTDDRFLHEAGSQDDARAYFGLTPAGIVAQTLAMMETGEAHVDRR